MWRPENWKNPWGGEYELDRATLVAKFPDGRCVPEVFRAGLENEFEAGADAMLRALKIESEKQKTAWQKIGELMGNVIARQNETKGCWVFIPDEED